MEEVPDVAQESALDDGATVLNDGPQRPGVGSFAIGGSG
jgi:hypothetical protein